MVEVLHHPELAFGLAAETLLLLGGGGGAGKVDAHPPHRMEPRAGADEILPTGPLVEESAKLPVAGSAAPVGRVEPGLVERMGKPGRHRLVHRVSGEPDAGWILQPRHDAGQPYGGGTSRWLGSAMRCRIRVAAAHGDARDVAQAAVELRG